jgi:hypothetical protein
MGIQSLSSLEIARPRPGSRHALRLVTKADANIRMPLDDEAPAYQRDNPGTVRGIIVALGFQAAALVLGIAFWELHFLFR